VLTDSLARVAELQDAMRRIDAALDEAGMTWLVATPTDELDNAYDAGREQLETMRAALQGELAVVRMGALL
jgi:hypothetical protein